MVGFVEVVAVAFIAQLLVLPGEKVQFIIAGLSTEYNPWTVVAAAGSAFAGWTAIEILVGEALLEVLPGVVLDGITAGLFLLFAVLLLRSAPASGDRLRDAATDGAGATARNGTVDLDVFGYQVPQPLNGFVPIFAMMAAGEFGDKTQLVTIGLAAQYGAHAGIWVGEMLAIIPVSIANALFFHKFSHRFDARKAHFFGAGVFAFFGLDTVLAMVIGFSVWEAVVGFLSEALLAML
ncbi:TMEM165/GDT1 family protein [Halobacteriales archaeon Cl-PHB]